MAPRTVSADPEAWQRVADAVFARRTQLDRTAAEVVEAAGRGLSAGVLSLIENNRQTSYSVRTLNALCRGLDWTDDSIERLVRGDDPAAASGPPMNRDADEESRLDAVERQVAEVLEFIAAERARLDQEREAIRAEREELLRERARLLAELDARLGRPEGTEEPNDSPAA